MNRTERLFYIWKYIEKKAFSPNSSSDIVNWLNCYHIFIYNLWEVEPDWKKRPTSSATDFSGKVEFTYPDFKFEYSYSIKSKDKFDISIKWNNFEWQYGYDADYFSEQSFLDERWLSRKELVSALKTTSEDDIEHIIRGKVVHPAMHHHILNIEFPHNIRLGVSYKNPYLLLYQFAFQLCHYNKNFTESDMKKKEFYRLTSLLCEYTSDFSRGQPPISPGIFFNLR